MTEMKIGMILKKLNVKGGTQRQALALAEELQKRGHEVVLHTFLYSPQDCYPEMLKNFRVVSISAEEIRRAHKITFPWRLIGPLAYNIRGTRMAKKLAAKMDSDFTILNPHDQVAYKVAYYYKKLHPVRSRPPGAAASSNGVPSVWVMNDPPALQWGYDRMKEVDEEFQKPVWRLISYWLFDQYDKWRFITKQDAIVTNDFFNRKLVKKYYGFNTFTSRNGPDFEHFFFKEKEPPRQGQTIKLLTSGIFMPHRRYQDTIRALPILTSQGIDARLTIIGNPEADPVYAAKIRKIISELGLKNRVRLAGRVSEKELVEAYHNHDIYIFQHHMQGDGLSPFEAAASGMPLIISRTAGAHELLTDRENVLLINPKDPADIAARVKDLISNPDLYSRLARNANDFCRKNLSWPRYADGISEVFEKVLREGKQI